MMVPFLLLYFSTLYDTGSCGVVPEKGIPRGQYSELEKGIYLNRAPSSTYSTIFLILLFLFNYPDDNLADAATSHYYSVLPLPDRLPIDRATAGPVLSATRESFLSRCSPQNLYLSALFTGNKIANLS